MLTDIGLQKPCLIYLGTPIIPCQVKPGIQSFFVSTTTRLHSIAFAAEMRRSLGCLFVYSYLLSLPFAVLAKDDPDYNAAENFRPDNVTGLNKMYSWVGS